MAKRSKAKIPTPSRSKEKAKPSSSPSCPWSIKAQDGFSECRQGNQPSPQETRNSPSQANEIPVNYFVNSERDFKSYAVKEYDAHQEIARKCHDEVLREVVGKAS